MRLIITKTAEKSIKRLDKPIKFVPEDEPLPDEVIAIRQGEADIAGGDVSDFDSIDWEL